LCNIHSPLFGQWHILIWTSTPPITFWTSNKSSIISWKTDLSYAQWWSE